MPTQSELVLDRSELRPQPIRDRDALELEAPVPRRPADMREAKVVERLWLTESPCPPALGGEPSELDEPGLLGMQLQVELRKSFAKIDEEPLCIISMLEPDDEVIGEPHNDNVATSMPVSPLPGPPVEGVVKVNIRK